MNLRFTKNLPTVAPKSLTVFNQSYTGEQKIIYRATREELKNLVASGLAVHVSRRKRKPISKGCLSPLPGSHPSPWSLGHGRNNEGEKTHTTNPLSPYPRLPPPYGSPTDLVSPGDLLPNLGRGRWKHLTQDLRVPELY